METHHTIMLLIVTVTLLVLFIRETLLDPDFGVTTVYQAICKTAWYLFVGFLGGCSVGMMMVLIQNAFMGDVLLADVVLSAFTLGLAWLLTDLTIKHNHKRRLASQHPPL